LMTSKSVEHYTPLPILKLVAAALGGITLDPCADLDKTVPADHHFTIEDDGLTQNWFGNVYMNPPYGRPIKYWVEKLVDEYTHGDVERAIAFVPSRTDTKWMRMLSEYPRCYLWGRITFGGNKNPAPFPSTMVYLGKATKRFVKQFETIGDCYVRHG